MTLQHCEECRITKDVTRIATRYLDTSNGWQITDEESEGTIPLCEEHIREFTSTPIPFVPTRVEQRADLPFNPFDLPFNPFDLPFELHRMGGPTWNRDWEHVDRFASAAGALARSETFERGTRFRIIDLRAKSEADGMVVWNAVVR